MSDREFVLSASLVGSMQILICPSNNMNLDFYQVELFMGYGGNTYLNAVLPNFLS